MDLSSGSSNFSGTLKSALWNDFLDGVSEKNNFTRMKKHLLLIVSVVFLASCSSPKYAYYFDHYDYNSGKKKVEIPDTQLAHAVLSRPDVSPLKIDQEAVTASAETRLRNVENVPVMRNEQIMDEQVLAEKRALLQQKYSSLTRAEKKDFRKELKAEGKTIIKAKKKDRKTSCRERVLLRV